MSTNVESGDSKPSSKGAPNNKKSSSQRGGGNGRPSARSKSNYEGRTTEVKGYVYDMVPRRADMYITTTNELTRKFGVDYGPDVYKSLENEQWVTYPMPSMPQSRGLVERSAT